MADPALDMYSADTAVQAEQKAVPIPRIPEEIPFDLYPKETRKTRLNILKVLESAAKDMGVLKPRVLDGNQMEPEYSYHMRSGEKVFAHLEPSPNHVNNDAVFVGPKKNAFAIAHGEDEIGEARLAATEYAKAFDKYGNLVQAQHEAQKRVREYQIRSDVSFSYGKIIERDDKKYLLHGHKGNGVIMAVYDEYGAEKKADSEGALIPLEKDDRIVMVSKEMGLTPDDIFGLMLHPGGKLKSARTLTENIKKYAQEKGCGQAFIVLDIK
jgi:hypothetical protein